MRAKHAGSEGRPCTPATAPAPLRQRREAHALPDQRRRMPRTATVTRLHVHIIVCLQHAPVPLLRPTLTFSIGRGCVRIRRQYLVPVRA